MRAYHRIIGDPPSRGFGSDIASVGFPGGSWAAKVIDRRLPPLGGIPFFDDQLIPMGKAMEVQRAYELQSLDFQRVAVAFSAEGMPAGSAGATSGRPHGYTHIVALAGEEGDTFTAGSPEEWLCYDQFMQLDAFWDLRGDEATMETTEWQPPPEISFAWDQSLPQGLQEALAFRYWRSATTRAFDSDNAALRPVRLCLSQERMARRIIEDAKAFFAACILPTLPGAARHILSLSVPVAARYLQKFVPTALAVLYPENVLGPADEMLFDLRSGAFQPLSTLEHAFARQFMQGEMPRTLLEIYARYAVLPNARAVQDTPFMADFDVAWILFRLENDRLSRAQAVALWRELHQLLGQRHGFYDEQIDALTAGLEGTWLDAREQLVLTAEDLTFVLGKALRATDEKLSKRYTALAATHHRSGDLPVFAQVINESMLRSACSDQRICEVFQTIMLEVYVQSPLGETQLAGLSSDSFAALCNTYPSLKQAMRSFTEAFIRTNPDCALFIMPLSVRYLEKTTALRHALVLLNEAYVQALPSSFICERIRNASSAFDSFNRKLYSSYLFKAFCAHVQDVQPLVEAARTMMQDTSDALMNILDPQALKAAGMALPLDNRQLDKLLEGLLPLAVSNTTGVHAALLQYVEKMLEEAKTAQKTGLNWLLGADGRNCTLGEEERRDAGVRHFVAYYTDAYTVPREEEFSLVLSWMHAAVANDKKRWEDTLKPLYEALNETGRRQLEQLIPHFVDTSAFPYVRSVHLAMLRGELIQRWTAGSGYFAAIAPQRARSWTVGSFAAEEILQDPAVEHIANSLLSHQYAQLTTTVHFETADQKIREQPQDCFAELARQTLISRFRQHIDHLICNQPTLAQAYAVIRLGERIGAVSDDRQYAVWCIQTIRQAESFIHGGLKEQAENDLASSVCQQIRSVAELGKSEVPEHLKQLLYREMESSGTFSQLSWRRRMAAAMIVAAMPDGFFRTGCVLKLLPFDKRFFKQPFDETQLPLLSQVVALFTWTGALHPNYPHVLLNALLQDDYSTYTSRVRAQRREAERLFPWLKNKSLRTLARVPQELVEWLTGNA